MMMDIDKSKLVIDPISEAITIPEPQKVQSRVSVDQDFSFAFYSASPVPNAFHRFMQRWLLGIYWEKVE